MSDRWESPDVAPDGSIDHGDDGPTERVDSAQAATGSRWARLRVSAEVFVQRQRYAAWTLVQLAGFAAFGFGAFRLFGIGLYGMDGLGPLGREVFTTVYLPGPWGPGAALWTLAWIWMAIGIAIVGVSTRQR